MKAKELKHVDAAMLESTASYFDSNNINVVSVGGERSAVLKIRDIESLVRAISASDEVCFRQKNVRGRATFAATKMGERLLTNIWAKEVIDKYYPIHDFNPFVKAFFESVEEHAQAFYNLRKAQLFNGDLVILIDSLNRIVERLRQRIRSRDFKGEINSHRRLSNKNHKSLLGYIDAIFEGRSRLLVLRVDLGYSKSVAQRHFREGLQFEEVKKHRERFLRLLRARVPPTTFLGHAWKLEFGLSKSFHYHCMFFLDGSKLREDIVWGKIIGELWVENATKGQGVYYNCNRTKNVYRACGIGMVDHSDKGMRENLKKAAIYLTKIEYYMRIATEGRARTFGRGEMPKKPLKKRGRPRGAPASEGSEAIA